ncbi:Serine/threonine-protein kinase PINK1, mitochondrial [Amphibalanus amphitrite]|uniref:non-specific serine/threonine protein kinase n=1 Tax=Amphibalanus amphitrite TaxID=1232801 RepID=A0A6A4X0D3_AMPAM|nr:Serine/threonine-protein kinase PINK1, mitochondrial [Amphibalanus amphitrite]
MLSFFFSHRHCLPPVPNALFLSISLTLRLNLHLKMNGMLLGQFLYTKLNDYVLKLSRNKLVHRLLTDGDRCSRAGPRGRPTLDPPSRTYHRVLLQQPPPPPAAVANPVVAWTTVLRQQVRWVTRQLVGSLVNPSSRLLSRQCKELAQRLLFSGGTHTLVAFVGITLTGDDGLVTKADRMEVLCADIKQKFVRDMHWPDCDPEPSGCHANVETLHDIEISDEIAKGCNAVVYKARIKGTGDARWNLALKMMFNYDAESNAWSILRAMHREVVPAPWYTVTEEVRRLVTGVGLRLADLPPHRNIVDIRAVLVDRVPLVGGALSSYPAALPARLNPDGAGRNASLFLLMKRYDGDLRTLLAQCPELSAHTRLLLLTQLLEGVTHLGLHRVAHRDLKTDNLLVDTSAGRQQPQLVISDFGCCLAETSGALTVPFTSWDVDRGGNLALMPPEISGGRPGRFASLDYSRADVWAVGTIAYEILGCTNPFYGPDRLNSATYSERDLPPLPASVPALLRCLVEDMLRRDPAQRVSARSAATICQLILWAPKAWFAAPPSHKQIRQWLLTLTAKVMCEWRSRTERDDRLEHVLVHTLLCRLTYADLSEALGWLQRHV